MIHTAALITILPVGGITTTIPALIIAPRRIAIAARFILMDIAMVSGSVVRRIFPGVPRHTPLLIAPVPIPARTGAVLRACLDPACSEEVLPTAIEGIPDRVAAPRLIPHHI